ncbi:MAG: kelch repeat-containing protein [Terracidiphilus sp.]
MRTSQKRILQGCVSGCMLAIAGISLPTKAQTTAPNEWTWVGGSSTIPTNCNPYPAGYCGQPGVYGALGTGAPGNAPGSRSGAASWIDGSGYLWLFGGEGIDSVGTSGHLNDLWKFDPSTKEWTWIGGGNTIQVDPGCAPYHCSVSGVYGTMGVPAPGNDPGGRSHSATWTDEAGHFWLFGGLNTGDAAPPFYGFFTFNDLWEFDPSTLEWTWMGGSNVADQPGVYGVLGTPAPGNIPGSRFLGSSWTDSEGHFWLFGGAGYDSLANDASLNDLWEFDPSTNEWTWMGGSSNGGSLGAYGTLGTPTSGNTPGARTNASIWGDSLGNLWLFGGRRT